MVRLKNFLYLLAIDTPVIIYETETELYRGASGDVPQSVLDNAYIKRAQYSNTLSRYIINIRYM